MPIEIRVLGKNAEEVQAELVALAEKFGVRAARVEHATVDDIDTDTLVHATGERLESLGYSMTITEDEDEAVAAPEPEPAPEQPKKRTRRPKLTPEEAKALLNGGDPEPETPAAESETDETVYVNVKPSPEREPELDAKQLEALKGETITKIQDIWLAPGGKDRVLALLKVHGDGAKSFVDVPAEKFPAIAAELA